jgi:UDP-2,3-diacylglucosamine pyrophosphatase LpxH
MPPLRFRSIFISDVHLGTPDCKAAYLLDFLRSTRSEFLYLVGDIIDLEALATRSYWHPLHSAIVGELLSKAETGTRVIYLPGNHDAPMRGLVGQHIGAVEVQLNALHIGADGRRYRVAHGDEFDPEHEGKPWLIRVGDIGLRLLCKLNRGFNALRRRVNLPYLPLSIITKSRIGKALAYIQRYEESVAQAALDCGVDGHICGHIHYGGIRAINGALYLNDGDWVEHCTALTEDDNGTMELLHWTENRTALARTSTWRLQPSPQVALAFASLVAFQARVDANLDEAA